MTKKTNNNIKKEESLKILARERRERHVEQLIKEAVITILAEQSIQAAPDDEELTSSVPPTPSPGDMGQPDEGSEQSGNEFTVDTMIDRLNTVRGGRSFTDPEVYGQMVTLFNNLSPEDKVVLDRLLASLSRVVVAANQVPQQQQNGNPSTVSAPPPPEPSQGGAGGPLMAPTRPIGAPSMSSSPSVPMR